MKEELDMTSDASQKTAAAQQSFYALLQMDARGLWGCIHKTSVVKEKVRFGAAMVVRSLLLVAFAILFISVLSGIFGQANSGLVVAGFCILLGIRFVPYGYRAADSVVALGLVLAIMVLGGVVSLLENPVISVVANFFFATAILVLVANDPPMGNAGLYIFGYLFVSQTPVMGNELISRSILAVVLWIICGGVLVFKHKGKFRDIRLHDLVKDFSLKNPTTLWQLRLAAGVAGVLLVGQLMQIPRGVWLGYACMSVLLPYQAERGSTLKRGLSRFGGVAIGSVLFALVAWLVPPQYHVLFGPIAGICIGFSKYYLVDSILNCFGALLLAESVYGLAGSAALRIWDNLIGVLFALAFTALLSFLVDRLKERSVKDRPAEHREVIKP